MVLTHCVNKNMEVNYIQAEVVCLYTFQCPDSHTFTSAGKERASVHSSTIESECLERLKHFCVQCSIIFENFCVSAVTLHWLLFRFMYTFIRKHRNGTITIVQLNALIALRTYVIQLNFGAKRFTHWNIHITRLKNSLRSEWYHRRSLFSLATFHYMNHCRSTWISRSIVPRYLSWYHRNLLHNIQKQKNEREMPNLVIKCPPPHTHKTLFACYLNNLSL